MAATSSSPFRVQIVARPSLPAWVPPPGTFAEFTLNVPHDAQPAIYAGANRAERVFANWCGAAFIADYGPRGAVAYHGGGEHFATLDSQGVIVLDCDTRLYDWRCVPAVPHTQQVAGGGDATNVWGEYINDGTAQSPHTYNSLCEMPASFGGGPRGSLVRVASNAGDVSVPTVFADGYACTHRFDLSKAIGGHSRLTGDNVYNSDGSGGPTRDQGGGACIDRLRQGWWSMPRGPGSGPNLSFTSKTGQITTHSQLAKSVEFPTLHHFHEVDVLVLMGQIPNEHIWICRPANDRQWTPIRPVGDTSLLQEGSIVYVGYLGPRWSTILKAFVGMEYFDLGGTTINVWKLAPPPLDQLFTGTWTWTREPLTTHDGSRMDRKDAAAGNGSWGKLLECPSLRSFVWTRHSLAKGQLLRLQGM